MPRTPRQLEALILEDGWRKVKSKGGHKQYSHNTKPGKVTIPWHPGDVDKSTERSILKQAGLE